jgi:hypothetical protein
LTLGVYGFEAMIQAPKSVRVWNAVVAPVAACALREIWGNKDGLDMLYCTAGIAVAIPLALLFDHLLTPPKQTEDCIMVNSVYVCVD